MDDSWRDGPSLPELDRRHAVQRRVDPEVVVPVHVVRELGPELSRRAERLAVDEQADVVPRGPDAYVGQVTAYMGARRPAAEAARDDVRHDGLVYRPGVHLEPLPAVCADQTVLPHDAADPAPAPADGDDRPPGDAFILREPYRPLLAARAATAAGTAGSGAAGRPGRVRMEWYVDLAAPRSPRCADMG